MRAAGIAILLGLAIAAPGTSAHAGCLAWLSALRQPRPYRRYLPPIYELALEQYRRQLIQADPKSFEEKLAFLEALRETRVPELPRFVDPWGRLSAFDPRELVKAVEGIDRTRGITRAETDALAQRLLEAQDRSPTAIRYLWAHGIGQSGRDLEAREAAQRALADQLWDSFAETGFAKDARGWRLIKGWLRAHGGWDVFFTTAGALPLYWYQPPAYLPRTLPRGVPFRVLWPTLSKAYNFGLLAYIAAQVYDDQQKKKAEERELERQSQESLDAFQKQNDELRQQLQTNTVESNLLREWIEKFRERYHREPTTEEIEDTKAILGL